MTVPSVSRPRTSVANLLPSAILRSPAHRLLSRHRLLLYFTGRRTGTRYATPVNYHQRGAELLIGTDSAWGRNLLHGAAVQMVLRGRLVGGRAEPVDDHDEAADALATLIRGYPPYRFFAHVHLDGHGEPDAAEVRAELARGRMMIRIRTDGTTTT